MSWKIPLLPLVALPFVVGSLGAATVWGQEPEQNPIRVAPKVVKPSNLRVGELFPALKGTAIDGREFDLATARKRKATVVALTSTSCPICKKYTSTLAKIEKMFRGKGVSFCFLNTLPSDELKDIKAAIDDHQLSGPYLHDKTDRWNETLGTRTTAEVFVFDSARTLVYRGAVDDQYGLGYSLNAPRKNYLVDALNSIVQGTKVEVAATTAPGCDLLLPAKRTARVDQPKVTYHNRVSRIMQNHCVNCHHDKGLSPFSLETAQDVISHAGMIRTVLKNKTMPPWFAHEKDNSSKWANDPSLSDADLNDLLTWLESEHALGDPADAPLPLKFDTEWNIGKPDKTFQLPRAFSIKATGTIPYRYARVETEFNEDKWVKAVEIRPSDRSVVHHVLVFIAAPGSRRPFNEGEGFFAAYVPGNSFQNFPSGFGKKIPAGSKLVFQIHYTPNGRATRDQTEIGFRFYKTPPKHVVRVKGIAQRDLAIAKNAENHRHDQSFVIRSHVKLLAFMPHMHVRGKAFRYDLIHHQEKDAANNKSETILDIPRYDFNWQLVYRLAEPISVFPGAAIKVSGWFDNSASNPANPNPNRVVPWGDQTTDEMLIGYVEYYDPSEIVSKTEKSDNGAPKKEPSKPRQLILTRAFQKYDKNGDGKVTLAEFNRPRLFKEMNIDGDDHLTLKEVLSYRN